MSYWGICKGYEIIKIPSITDIANVMRIILFRSSNKHFTTAFHLSKNNKSITIK